jgi:CRISPR-associated protein Csd1
MILQSLCKYYDILAADEACDIPQEGYSNAKISYALNISIEGDLKYIDTLKEPAEKGNKFFPRIMTVPEQIKRSSGIESNFLCDNSKYIFGISKDKKEPIEIFEKHFEAFKTFNFAILENAEDDGAKAILNFLKKWNVQEAEETLKSLSQDYEDFLQGANFIFRLEDEHEYIHNRKNIKDIWAKYKNKNLKGEIAQCLITGKKTQIALLHENLKNIRGAQPAGAAIVSFNIPSFVSYGKKQSYNAPVGLESAFKYTTVLNYMLQNDSKQKIQIGDATTVFWAEFEKAGKNPKYIDLVDGALNPSIKSDDKKTEEEKLRDDDKEKLIKDCFEALNQGKKLSDVIEDIEDETNFYILGLSPNNARVSVRFFHRDTFGTFMKNLKQHHEDLDLEGSRFEHIPPWIILNETTIKNSSKDKPSPLLSGRLMNSIITGNKYPDDLYMAIIRRIQAEQDNKEKKTYFINHTRVAVIKAYLTRLRKKELQEVLKVSLNEETTNTAYRLGRLFAMLERIQIANVKKDNPKKELNSTIKDRYFSSASTSPKTVLPNLINLSQAHLSQLGKKKKGLEIYFQKQLGEIMQGMEAFRSATDKGFPSTLSNEEQGLFILGYYQQRFDKQYDDKEIKAEKEQPQEIVEISDM